MSCTVALFGGTFNPPHRGHLAVLHTICQAFSQVIVMPAWQPPHKVMPKSSPTPEQRLDMVRAMCVGMAVEISEYELSRGQPCYTADTLTWLHNRHPADKLSLVVGADMFFSLPDWHDFKRIAALADIAVLCRENGQDTDIEAMAARLTTEYSAKVQKVLHEPVAVSSTDLRLFLSRGDKDRYQALLPSGVVEYIQTYHLYKES